MVALERLPGLQDGLHFRERDWGVAVNVHSDIQPSHVSALGDPLDGSMTVAMQMEASPTALVPVFEREVAEDVQILFVVPEFVILPDFREPLDGSFLNELEQGLVVIAENQRDVPVQLVQDISFVVQALQEEHIPEKEHLVGLCHPVVPVPNDPGVHFVNVGEGSV